MLLIRKWLQIKTDILAYTICNDPDLVKALVMSENNLLFLKGDAEPNMETEIKLIS